MKEIANTSDPTRDNGGLGMRHVAMVALLLLAAGILFLPQYLLQPRRSHPAYIWCINNLRQIDGAKQQWALENKKHFGDIPEHDDLYGTDKFIKSEVVCPTMGSYNLNCVGLLPTCPDITHTARFALSHLPEASCAYSTNHCIANLQYLDIAKQAWAADHKLKDGEIFDESRLFGSTTNEYPKWPLPMPKCPAGGIYTLGPVGAKPQCSIVGHNCL